ncbi:MAG: crotonase/enoyl-CoA hydratase family protein [Solirubrobacteraceae bacterium]
MADPPVLTSRRDGVQVITINRPQARNAIDRETAEGIAGALDELDRESELRVGVITGAGGNLSAGMDLKAFARGERPYVEGRGSGGIVQRPPRKPLIAAVEGYAVALGFEIVLACDLIVASRDARFGLPEVKRSLVAVAGGLIRLPRRIAYHQAMELALTGEFIDAHRASELGLVNRLVEPGRALAEALELSSKLIAAGPLALEASKAIVSRSLDWTLDEAWERQGEIAGPVFTSQDAREGAIAFAEKREPAWKGR